MMRYKKLKAQAEKVKRSGKSSKKGIKKETMQAVIVGFTNSGKSSLLKSLTNSEPKITPYKFTTKNPVIGTLNYKNMNIQLIELPAFDSEFYDRGLVHTADTLLILVKNLEDIEKLKKGLEKAGGKKIIVFNLFSQENVNERKISATLQSKKHDFFLIDLTASTGRVGGWGEGGGKGNSLEELKEKIFKSFGRIRIFTKEPGKVFNRKTSKPLVLEPKSTIKDAAEKILHGFSKKVKESFVTGPSSKFPNQKVGMKHVLKDLDIVEFKTR